MQNINTARILGRTTASSGDVEELTAGSNLSLTGGSLNVASTLTGITLTTPTLTTPTINGEIDAVVTKVTGDSPYTLTATNRVIRADASSGNLTLNLPASSGLGGTVYTIKRIDTVASTNTVTIDANSTETIDGLLTWKLRPGEYVVIQSDGTNWITLYHPNPSLSGYYFRKNSTNDRRYVAGMWSYGDIITTTTSPAANTLWALPIVIDKVTKFDTITFHITTSQASQNARAGIYNDDGNGYPGSLIFDTGSISTASTGAKDTTITSSLQIFQPGLYWLAWETSATTIQIRGLNDPGNGILGTTATLNTGRINYGYSVAHTYGALPDPYTGSASSLFSVPSVSVPVPVIGLRAI
jgi:hypothetical protein